MYGYEVDHSSSEDLASQLRRQISQATNEKEAAKLDLDGLKRTVESHLLRLNSVLGGGDVNMERLNAAIQAFDADLRGRLDTHSSSLGEGSATEGTYEVLRHSLTDAQKRCQELNGDMLRVADANEELMNTLKTLKNTNKRLVEEVQKQTEELSNLTQQRLLDMENMSRLEEAFRHEKAMWQQEAHRSIEDEQRHCEEEFIKMRDQLTSQLEECRRHAKVVASKAGTLRTLQSQLKTEVQGFAQNVSTGMKKLQRDLVERIVAHAKHSNGEHAKLRDIHHNLEVKLRAEKEVREGETEGWRNRHALVAGELDDIVQKRDREVSDLSGKVQAVMAAREAESAAMLADRGALHDQIEAQVKEVALLEAMMQTSRRKVLQLESRAAQGEGERERLQSLADTLRQQIRESDEALGEAVRSNESLREQMEVQRLDAHSANERDLKLCREMYQRRLGLAAQQHLNDQGELGKRIRSLEDDIGMKAGELHSAKETLARKTRARDALQRDVLMWKAQHEIAHKMKSDVDQQHEQFRQENLIGELPGRQEQFDELSSLKAELELRRSQIVDEAQKVQQAVKTRELQDMEQAQAIQDMHRDHANEHQRLKTVHMDVDGGLASAKAEAATVMQQMSERRDALEQDLARLTSELEAEKRDHERKLQAEKLNHQHMRESLEKLRAEHKASFKAAFEGPGQKVSALEGAITDLQRNSDAELNGYRQKSEKLRQRIEELEGEMARAQARLEQTEHEVQEGTARVNSAKANQRAAREALEREKNLKTEELNQVQRSIAQKTDQLKALTRSGEDLRKRMLREIEDVKASKARQIHEADNRLNSLRSEYSMAIEDADASAALNNSRDRLDGLWRENELLRRHVSENRHGSSGVGTLGSPTQDGSSAVQRSAAAMEERAAELRRCISGSR
eukprot:TRINITY_DN1059_c1_g1_i1.p1 TRINITY_DN1059_c1_g1~~TRINITY_DN1059_c1_g1_i1.p1  ORF type:complete len:935 (-),score=252.86 TRINITY_DN1059_c1_g1_i1:150-2882(-)